jgi:hypothetical protein
LNATIPAQHLRNFYLIAHGCNNIEKINKAFTQKVNGIECDLWADEAKKWWISHEGLEKTELLEWLTYIEKAEQSFNQQLSVIIFDIKSEASIVEVRDVINENLPAGLPRIYSTAKIAKGHIFQPIVPGLASHEGIAIDEEDNPEEVAAFYKDIGATQCWYGNGITLIPLNDRFHQSMQRAAPIRDTNGPFSKIYTWSVHRKEALRKYIEEDKVDAIIVGLDSLLTTPVSHALDIINANNDIKLADRNCSLF